MPFTLTALEPVPVVSPTTRAALPLMLSVLSVPRLTAPSSVPEFSTVAAPLVWRSDSELTPPEIVAPAAFTMVGTPFGVASKATPVVVAAIVPLLTIPPAIVVTEAKTPVPKPEIVPLFVSEPETVVPAVSSTPKPVLPVIEPEFRMFPFSVTAANRRAWVAPAAGVVLLTVIVPRLSKSPLIVSVVAEKKVWIDVAVPVAVLTIEPSTVPFDRLMTGAFGA